MKAWFTFCKAHNKRPKKFPRDVPTRWNSTYELLNESYAYKDLLCEFITQNFPILDLSANEWIVCKKILDLLKVFNDATYSLSGVYYPTTHLFIVECVNIVAVLQEHEADPQLIDTITSMRSKWLAYYKNIPLIYLIASIFDPRIKLDQLTEYLKMYYDCLDLSDQVNIPVVIENLKTTLTSLYNEFCSIYNLGDIVASQSSASESSRSSSKLSKGYQMLMQAQKKFKRTEGINSEVDNYLTVSFEFDDSSTDFSLLDWWKKHSSQYPVLALLAKHILATPCSTVAVEQAFSAGGAILDETRSRLTPDSLEAQACLDDWTKAQYRQQEIDRQAASTFFHDDDNGTGTTTGSSD